MSNYTNYTNDLEQIVADACRALRKVQPLCHPPDYHWRPCPGWPDHWTNGGFGITKLGPEAYLKMWKVVQAYGDPCIWLDGYGREAALYSTRQNLSDFWAFHDQWPKITKPYQAPEAHNPYVPLEEKWGQLAVIATRKYANFTYGTVVTILKPAQCFTNGVWVQICGTNIERIVYINDLYWENKDNNHYP